MILKLDLNKAIDCINIFLAFGYIETKVILNEIKNNKF
jgi:hypothetical protein